MCRRALIISGALVLTLVVNSALADALLPDRAELSDPTRPDNWNRPAVRNDADKPEKKLNLESILRSASRRVAIINGRSLGEGERIDDAMIVRIESDHVTLRRNGQKRVLRLKPVADFKR